MLAKGCRYLGFDGKRVMFNHKGHILKLFTRQVSPLEEDLGRVIQNLERKKQSLFDIAIYWDKYGFYVEKRKNKLQLINAVTKIDADQTYDSINDVPDKYMNQPIQKWQKCALLRVYEFNTSNNRLSTKET